MKSYCGKEEFDHSQLMEQNDPAAMFCHVVEESSGSTHFSPDDVNSIARSMFKVIQSKVGKHYHIKYIKHNI